MELSRLGINKEPPKNIERGQLPETFLEMKKWTIIFMIQWTLSLKTKCFLQAESMIIKFQLTGQEHCQIKLIEY